MPLTEQHHQSHQKLTKKKRNCNGDHDRAYWFVFEREVDLVTRIYCKKPSLINTNTHQWWRILQHSTLHHCLHLGWPITIKILVVLLLGSYIAETYIKGCIRSTQTKLLYNSSSLLTFFRVFIVDFIRIKQTSAELGTDFKWC